MTRILVTGGAGAIGSNVVRNLVSRGTDVVVLDDLSSGHRHLLPEEVEFVEGSVSDDEHLRQCFDTKPDYVIHMAALFANQNSVDHPQDDLTVNGIGTLKILEWCVSSNVKKLLYCSSSCVYGSQKLLHEGITALETHTPYAMTKLLGERYCWFWAETHGFDTVAVRLFNNYGPNEYPGKYRNVIPNFFALAMAGKPLPITGSGEETRDFTFVSDTVEGILGALFGNTEPGAVFNIGSGKDSKIIDLALRINELANNGAGCKLLPRRSWDHVTQRRCDISKASKAFAYQPKVSLDEGLALTFDWFKEADV